MSRRAASIDVGSNAIRLLIGKIDEEGSFEREFKLREPVRLGASVFDTGKISEEAVELAVQAFKKFRQKLNEHGLKKVVAVATSAVRESSNGKDFVDLIEQSSGIPIHVIDYKKEAELIHQAVLNTLQPEKNQELCTMDIGGGSVEFIFARGSKVLDAVSYPIGTVKCLEALNSKSVSLEKFIFQHSDDLKKRMKKLKFEPEIIAGTGGNLVSMGVLRCLYFDKTNDARIKLSEVEKLIEKLGPMTVEQRMKKFNLKQDRADVLVPALYSTKMFMEATGCEKILIPHVGLREGLLIASLQGSKSLATTTLEHLAHSS